VCTDHHTWLERAIRHRQIGLPHHEAVDPALRTVSVTVSDEDTSPTEIQDGTAETTVAVIARLRARLFRRELLPPLLLAGSVFLVHDVGYVLAHNYWVDESWVAISTKYPLRQLPDVTSTTPIGWSALVRPFVFAGQQGPRLLPLAFAAAAVAIAYAFARNLDWRDDRARLGAGVLAAIGVLMVPAMLERNDLKQYTADACLALTTLALTSRLERAWSRRSLAVLAATVGGGMLFSHTVAFVGSVAFVAIVAVQLVRREWRRALEAGTAAAVALAIMVTVYEVFDVRAIGSRLTNYWYLFYMPVGDGAGASWHFLYVRLGHVRSDFGLGPSWVALPFVLAGMVTLFRVGRPITACAIILLAPLLITLSAAKKYPLLDARTSAFLMVIVVVVAAIGVAGLCMLLLRWSTVASVALAVAVTASFVTGGFHDVRAHTIPWERENTRAQTQFVAAHRAPDDVILVNVTSSWGFAYYWNHRPLARRPSENVDTGFLTVFPTERQIIVASGRKLKDVRAALQRALAMAKRTNAAHIWIVKAHVSDSEARVWNIAFQKMHIEAVAPGPRGLLEITVS